MNTTIQDMLLDLFQQVSEDPDSMPAIPIDAWQEGSEERHLLTGFRDMLERLRQSKRQAEAQLREKEEQYRSIFEATIDGLSINDLEDGRVIEANPALCRMFGYTFEEFIDLPPTATIHPDTYHVVAEVLQKVQAGSQFQTRFVALRKDGTAFHAEGRGTPFIYKGKPHLLGSTRDITVQVQAEQQLRDKEEQYRAIFEASTDALVISRLEDGRIVEANPAECKMFGYTYEETIGLLPTATVPPDYLHVVAEGLQKLMAGGRNDTVMVALRKDGTPFPIEVHSTLFTYKGEPHLLSVARDITYRVEAEQQLREKEEQYRSVFEATDDGLAINDLDGFYIEANPAYCSMLGYTHEELIGLHYSQMTYPEYYPALDESVRTIQAGGQFEVQGLARRKDGSPLPVEAHSTPFIYKGKPHVLGVMRDITERVEAEKQLREKEEQYRAVFEATTDALVVLDPDGFYIEANPAMCSMYGYTNEELIGLHTSALTAPESLHILTESIEKIKVVRGFQAEGQGLRKDGSVFYAEAHLTPFTYQGKPHLLASTRDITERVQAQQLLEQRVEERTRELSTLLEISHNVASTLELKSLLGLILEQLKVVADYTGSSILIVEGDDLVIFENRGPYPVEQALHLHFPVKRFGMIWEMLCRQETVIIDDVRDDSLLAQTLRVAVGDILNTTFRHVRTWMSIPLMLKEQIIGVLVLTSQEPHYFTFRHAALALGIANQAAIAIENARLYESAQELAALEERQKLARELHDSVSQALYGISLGTHAARTALERDPGHVAEPLDYVLSLAEAGLAEMRALIFELRPESLETEGLVSALSKQAGALQARHEILVSAELCDEPDLFLRVKQELYRIAQEAMHNTVKHARASHIDLRLEQTADGVLLEVRDDGAGFDPTASYPGHLGLHSMLERVANLGGTFEIESAPGAGTRVRVCIPGRV
jgi:PAS domain S-box-containing protein